MVTSGVELDLVPDEKTENGPALRSSLPSFRLRNHDDLLFFFPDFMLISPLNSAFADSAAEAFDPSSSGLAIAVRTANDFFFRFSRRFFDLSSELRGDERGGFSCESCSGTLLPSADELAFSFDCTTSLKECDDGPDSFLGLSEAGSSSRLCGLSGVAEAFFWDVLLEGLLDLLDRKRAIVKTLLFNQRNQSEIGE